MLRVPRWLRAQARVPVARLLSTAVAHRGLITIPFEDMINHPNPNPMSKASLPVPTLEATEARYLRSLRGLVAQEEMARHEALAAAALRGPLADKLQRFVLHEWAAKQFDSYIQEIWEDMYLRGRWALPVNSNPFHELASLGTSDPLDAAAAATTACAAWLDRIRCNGIPMQSAAMCPRQIARQVGMGRVAQVGRDVLIHTPQSKHVVVLCSGAPYKVNLFDAQGVQLSVQGLKAQLTEILRIETKRFALESENAVLARDAGLLSRLMRDEWACHRASLAQNSHNQLILEALDTALFVVNLDIHVPADDDERSSIFLKGIDGKNRWWDKHQLTILGDGSVGVNFEHSYSDGLAWQSWLCEAVPQAEELVVDLISCQSTTATVQAEKMEWVMSKELQDACVSAAAVEDHCISSVVRASNFGKDIFKSWGMSPDAAFQIGLQAAYARQHPNQISPTYEACATSTFLSGRTEVIRSASKEAADFAALMNSPELLMCSDGRNQICDASRKAAMRHMDLTKEAVQGQGVDRHLTALQAAAEQLGLADVPELELFQEEIFNSSRTWTLSTSNLSPRQEFIKLFGFGPVTAAGYGIGYLIHKGSIDVNITNFAGNGTDAKALGQSLLACFKDMDMCFKNLPSPANPG